MRCLPAGCFKGEIGQPSEHVLAVNKYLPTLISVDENCASLCRNAIVTPTMPFTKLCFDYLLNKEIEILFFPNSLLDGLRLINR